MLALAIVLTTWVVGLENKFLRNICRLCWLLESSVRSSQHRVRAETMKMLKRRKTS